MKELRTEKNRLLLFVYEFFKPTYGNIANFFYDNEFVLRKNASIYIEILRHSRWGNIAYKMRLFI